MHVVVEPGDVRHEGEPIGGVGRYGVGTNSRCQPAEGWRTRRAIFSERMNRHTAALIIGAQQILAVAVRSEKGGRAFLWDRPEQGQPAGALVYPEARDRRSCAMSDIERASVGTTGHH